MYHIIIWKIARNNIIAWSQSEFLFRQYLSKLMERYNDTLISIMVEQCMNETQLKWLFKRYGVSDTKITESKIVLIHDRGKINYAVTTVRNQKYRLGGGSIFKTKEDDLRCTYVSTAFLHIVYLKRFSKLEKPLIDSLYHLVADKYLDSHSIDMTKYFICSGEEKGIYRI